MRRRETDVASLLGILLKVRGRNEYRQTLKRRPAKTRTLSGGRGLEMRRGVLIFGSKISFRGHC